MATPLTILASTTVSASGAGSAVDGLDLIQSLFGIFNVSAIPTGGAPTLDVFLQTSPDAGTTWRDIAAFQFTTSIVVKMFSICGKAAGATTILAASDAALATNTVVQGPWGDRLRVKYTFAAGGSSGTYTLSATVVAKPET